MGNKQTPSGKPVRHSTLTGTRKKQGKKNNDSHATGNPYPGKHPGRVSDLEMQARMIQAIKWATKIQNSHDIEDKMCREWGIQPSTARTYMSDVAKIMSDEVGPAIAASYHRMVAQLQRNRKLALSALKPDYKAANEAIKAEVEVAKLFRVAKIDVNMTQPSGGELTPLQRMKAALGTSAEAERTEIQVHEAEGPKLEEPTQPPVTDECSQTGQPPESV